MSTPPVGQRSRVYRGSTIEELVPQIQRELGPDAIVLRQRQGLTGGVLGFFQRSFVELEAIPGGPRIDVYDEQPALAHEPLLGRGSAPPPIPAPAPASTPALSATPAPSARPAPSAALSAAPAASSGSGTPPSASSALSGHRAYVTEQLAALAMAGRGQAAPSAGEQELTAPSETEDSSQRVLDSFAAALAEAEARVPSPQRMTAHHPPPRPVAPRPIPPEPAPPSPPPGTERWTVPPAPRGRKRAGVSIQRKLQGLGIGEAFAHELIDGASAHVLPLAPSGGLTRAVRATLAQRIPVLAPLPTTGAAVVVVGAGGSGKTSYCAALMRAYRAQGALAASYASLSWDPQGTSLNVLLSPHVMWPASIAATRTIRAVRRARGEGLLLLDAPELSPANRVGIRELERLIGQLEPERVLVALPATLSAAAAAQLLGAFAALRPNGLVVTHADETDQIGVAIEAACNFGLAPEYLLDRNRSGGWRVGRLDPAGLAERLLR